MTAEAQGDDADLASRAASGDDLAYGRLMQRHKGPLYPFVLRHVGDADAALEVLQETFVAAWKAIGRYDGIRPFAVWLRAIALNKCRDRARRLAVRRIIFADRDVDDRRVAGHPDESPDAEAVLLARQRAQALERAIAELPAKLKEPLILTHFDELSHQEAASLLGVSVKTVETRIYRARQKLAQRLRIDGSASSI